MIRMQLVTVVAVGLVATACSYNSTTTQAVVPAGPLTASEQACLDYGFTPGTGGYERCVSREHAARVAGRVPYGYAEARLAADARDACYSYGLEPGSVRYDRCVAREIDARSYRAEAYVAPVSTTVVYTTPPVPAYVPPAPPSPPAGVQAFRDEYGFRYDGQGNRIDARGNIISPQSTTP
jgi:hypothetical protein